MTTWLHGLAATLPPDHAHGWVGHWSPGIGDPTAVGWITVGAYFLAALACWTVRLGTPDPRPGVRRKEHLFWVGLTLALLFLCINKQLDLQTALTEFLRGLSKRQGWYDVRFAYQKFFVAAMALAAAGGIWFCLWLTRDLAQAVKTSGVGLVLIVGFVLIRAASFHHIDRLLGQTVLLLNVNWLIELGGIAVVLVGATRRWRQLRAARIAQIGSSEMRA